MPVRLTSLSRADAKTCTLSTPQGEINYLLFKSARRRTMEVSIHDSLDIRVIVPRYVTEKEIRTFILGRSRWILARFQEAQRRHSLIHQKQYKNGDIFLFLGKKYPLSVSVKEIRRPNISFDGAGWTAEVSADEEDSQRKQVRGKLIQWYRHQAREILGSRVFHYERIMGLAPLKIAIRSQKSVWGTCRHHDRKLSLNWQLILAPMAIIDYVVVHELAHLKYPNHSKRFWHLVEKYVPDYKVRRKWLTQNRADMALP